MKQIKLKPPHGWIGGKSKLADEIIKYIPPHNLYIEVFGGALNILYAKPRSRFEVVNDINSDLVNMHRVIQKHPESLANYLKQLLISREIFEDIKLHQNDTPNKIHRAANYYYLLTQSFGSKGDDFGMFAKARNRPRDIYRSFSVWSQRLRFVTIENMSFETIIPLYDGEDAFFYCDPPYVETESYYKNTGGFGMEHHTALSELLKKTSAKWMVSYNDHEIVRGLYNGYNIINTKEIRYTLSGGNSSKSVSEILVTNYDVDNILKKNNNLFNID